MSTVPTDTITHRFTLPGSDPGTFGGTHSVKVEITLVSDGEVIIDLAPGDMFNRRPVALNLNQFNQLRAKIFEVTGKVV